MNSVCRWFATSAAAGAAGLAGLAVIGGPASPAAGQSIEFIIDDGASEQGWGAVCLGFDQTVSWGWVNRFVNDGGAAIRIVRLQIAFSADEAIGDQSSIGDAVTGLIYVDPASTGDPM